MPSKVFPMISRERGSHFVLPIRRSNKPALCIISITADDAASESSTLVERERRWQHRGHGHITGSPLLIFHVQIKLPERISKSSGRQLLRYVVVGGSQVNNQPALAETQCEWWWNTISPLIIPQLRLLITGGAAAVKTYSFMTICDYESIANI